MVADALVPLTAAVVVDRGSVGVAVGLVRSVRAGRRTTTGLPIYGRLSTVFGCRHMQEGFPLTTTPAATTIATAASATTIATAASHRHPPDPGCCSRAVSVGANTSSDPDTVCLFRIPVVLRVPGTRIVLAFAEARLGGGAGCADGSGPAVAYRRSADGGRSWAPLRWIANDTDPIHVALKDHIVLGMSHFDPASQTSFLFYTTCYRMCEFTTTLVSNLITTAIHRALCRARATPADFLGRRSRLCGIGGGREGRRPMPPREA